MPKSKERNKKKRKKSKEFSHTSLKLVGAWRDLYLKNSFSKIMISSKGEKKNHIVFNALLEKYLIECQENNYIPSKESLEEKASIIFETARRRVILTDIEPNRMNPEFIVTAIKNSDVQSKVYQKESKNNSRESLLDVYMIINSKGLSQDETNYLIHLFKGEFKTEDDYVIIHTLTKRIQDVPNSREMDRIKDIIINNILSITKKQYNKDYGEFPWRESIYRKIRRNIDIFFL